MPRCAGIKRDGGRCTVVVGPGQSHCYAHDPDRSKERKLKELGELAERLEALEEVLKARKSG